MQRTLLVALLVAITLPASSPAQSRRTQAAMIAQLVDSLSSRAVADGLSPGLGVAVTMDGKTILSRSYGMTDETAGIRAADNTLWYLASTSKSLTGFGVSLLAERGTLRFEDPITKLLPKVQWNPEVHADSLTLAKFLSHTHRVNDDAVVQSAAFTGAIPESQWPGLIAMAGQMPTADLVYSNFGYNVAAMVIDALRPEGWRKFLEKNIQLPVGMRETYTHVSGIDSKRIAKPHGLNATGKYSTLPFFKTDRTMNSAGGHLATMHDLARWVIVQTDSGMIDGHRVFSKKAIEISQHLIAKQTREQSKRFAFFDRDGWAAGWDIGSYQGERMVSRFGSYGETRSHLSFLPARRTGVVVMSNGGLSMVTDVIAAFAYDLEAGRPDAQDSATARMDRLRKQFASAPTAITRQDSVRAARQRVPLRHALADFAGKYEANGFGQIVISFTGGRLQYRWGDLYGPVEIFDATKDQLRIELVGSGNVLTFGFPASGPAGSIALSTVTFHRVP